MLYDRVNTSQKRSHTAVTHRYRFASECNGHLKNEVLDGYKFCLLTEDKMNH